MDHPGSTVSRLKTINIAVDIKITHPIIFMIKDFVCYIYLLYEQESNLDNSFVCNYTKIKNPNISF